jgi:hypothetical protein
MKVKLTQDQIDGLVRVDRFAVKATVRGVGFNDVGFLTTIDRKHIWQYQLWQDMLKRCFDEKYKQHRSTYEHVKCCDEWLSFAAFLEWCNKQVDYAGKPVGFALDKDIIVRGNQIYSTDACSFVPQAVNSLLTDSGAARGDLPVGVSLYKTSGKFKVKLSCFGKVKRLGLYTTIEDAAFAYKVAKEAHIKIVATQYKDVLLLVVYESLMNWEII